MGVLQKPTKFLPRDAAVKHNPRMRFQRFETCGSLTAAITCNWTESLFTWSKASIAWKMPRSAPIAPRCTTQNLSVGGLSQQVCKKLWGGKLATAQVLCGGNLGAKSEARAIIASSTRQAVCSNCHQHHETGLRSQGLSQPAESSVSS